MSKNPVTDPAVLAFKRYKRASRAYDAAYSAMVAAEAKLWNGKPHEMEPSGCVFPDSRKDEKRREYEERYAKARREARLASYDDARNKTYKEYWAAFAATVRAKSTTPAGLLAKVELACMNFPHGDTDYDTALIRAIRADLKRLMIS